MKEVIHFAHGNGFPSSTYFQIFKRLTPQFHIEYIDRVGHNPKFPVTDNWHNLVDEVIDSIERKSTQPVIAVGHSLGGVLSFRAAIKRPELFKAVIMLDSPILGRFKSRLLKLSKTMGMVDHITPAFQSKLRKTHWSSKEDALKYLRGKPLFRHFTDTCLNDYVEYGMNETSDGYELKFDRSIEYQIYRTIPHMLYEYEGKLKVPCGLIYGSKSNIIDRYDLSNMKKKYNIVSHKMNGTHMFPMEDPDTTADLILNTIEKILS